jgi:general secretion pathway protein H
MEKKAARVTRPISQTKIKTLFRSADGFTLIELMVVVAIIAGTVGLVIPRIGNRDNQIRQTLRDLTTLSHELHQKSKLTGAAYRIVFDLKEGARGKEQQAYWVEKSLTATIVKPGEEKIKPEKDRDGKIKKVSDFEPDPSIFKKPKTLPNKMHFEKIELSRLSDPILTGKAYIHYLPQGLVEEAAIHLKSDDGHEWTIAIEPLTGKAEVVTNSVSLQEMKNQ